MDDEREQEADVQSATQQATGDGGAGADPEEGDGLTDPRDGFDGRNRSSTTTGEGGGEG